MNKHLTRHHRYYCSRWMARSKISKDNPCCQTDSQLNLSWAEGGRSLASLTLVQDFHASRKITFNFQKIFSLFLLSLFFFFCLRGSMIAAFRTVTVHCACQKAVAGLCTAKRFVWGSWDDSERPMSVEPNVSSQHHTYVINTEDINITHTLTNWVPNLQEIS